MKKLHIFLRERRAELGITQKQVGTYLGYSSPQFISNIERGLCQPPLSSLKKLAKLYKITPRDLAELMVEFNRERIYKALQLRGQG